MEHIVNLTPHPLVFADGRTIESSGIARCESRETEVGTFAGIPVVITAFGAVTDLPLPARFCELCGRITPRHMRISGCMQCTVGPLSDTEENHMAEVGYVVSSITAQACGDRDDVFVPARPIRDDKGRIIGCGALGRIV